MQLLAAIILAAACRTASTPRATTTDKTSPTSQRHTHENLNGVLWMQTSAEYRALALQAYRLATTQLDAAVRDPRWTAAVEQTSDPSKLPPAVVLDLDETVLDNSAFEARRISNGVLFSEDEWNRWCEERSARPIPGAVEFLTHAQALGVKPIYITNRDHRVEQATRDVLAKIGVPLDATEDTILAPNENGWTAADKTVRRQFVSQRYRILLMIGDNFEDFAPATHAAVPTRLELFEKYADYWGRKWIVMPNPIYGSWEQAITFGDGQLTDAQRLAAKYRALRF
jgi:acid phosphatase